MNSNIQKVIDALESGDYPQTSGKLSRIIAGQQCFCVEGVLCEVYRQETGKGQWAGDGETKSFMVPGSSMGFRAASPPEVLRWAGVYADCLMAKDEDRDIEFEAYVGNDDGMSFARLAPAIRAYYGDE